MTREQWHQIKTIAIEAWALPPAERPVYVSAACGADALLLREVESLIASMGAAGNRFETPSLLLPRLETAIRDVVDLPPVAAASGRIGGWRILRPLGHGGMGTVYLAERAGDGFHQRAAIKLARGGFADGLLQQRFLEERRILATLDHPDIARLIDGGTTGDGAPYVVMEFVDGVPIDTYCREHALGLRERLELFRRVCASVHYAHQRLVVHRDLKAANILVTADGTPKLLDFGIAKLLDPSAQATQTLLRMVTPDSASPEQIQGTTITTSTDVYALGALLYRLLTGRGPYGEGRSESDLIRAVCEETPRPPSAVAQDRIPADVDVIVMKALRKEPERRYGSVEQLADDLRRYLEGRPVTAAPDSASYRTRKFVERHWLGVAAAAALTITLCAGIGATLWQARVARQERERADANRARAERQFSAVRGLANAVLNELHDAVIPLAGSMKAREILLRRATEYLDTLKKEAAGDPALTRELVEGYRRLGQVQGAGGLPNLGDAESAARSYREAAALLESIGGATSPNPLDRAQLADIYVRLAGFERDEDAAAIDKWLRQAQQAIEGVSATGKDQLRVLSVYNSVWTNIAFQQRAVKDHEGARQSLLKGMAASEQVLKLSPDSLNASRNLSLNYKNLGATLENLGRRDEALPFYDKAMALDLERVKREPTSALWKLDLSFSYGSIGAALQAVQENRRALEYYDKAVKLREEAVAIQPDEDFGKGALARGYDRQATLRSRLGDVAGAVDAQMQRAALYDKRLREHPERENFRREYVDVAVNAADQALGSLERGAVSAAVRRREARRIETVLNDVARVRAQWIADKRPGTIGPKPQDFDWLVGRCRALSK